MANLKTLAHPGWVGVVLPLALAVGSTFSPDVIRGVLLIAAVIGATWTFHRTAFAGGSLKRTGIASLVLLVAALGVFALGHALDAR